MSVARTSHHSDLEEKQRLAIQFLQIREKEDYLGDQQVRIQSVCSRVILDFNDLERTVQASSLNLELIKFQVKFNYEWYLKSLDLEEKPDLDADSFENLLHTGEPSFIGGSSLGNVLQIEEVEEKKELDPKEIQKLMKWRIGTLRKKIKEISENNKVLSQQIAILEGKVLTYRASIRQLEAKRNYLEKEKERIISIGRTYQRKINEQFHRRLASITFSQSESASHETWKEKFARGLSWAKKKVSVLSKK